VGSNPILSTIFNIESAPGNNRFVSCSSSFLYADVRKAENAALSLVRIPHLSRRGRAQSSCPPPIFFKHSHKVRLPVRSFQTHPPQFALPAADWSVVASSIQETSPGVP